MSLYWPILQFVLVTCRVQYISLKMRPKYYLHVLILSGVLSHSALSIRIATYYLNKHLPYGESFSSTDPEPECLYARGNFSIKQTHTVCYRYNALSYAGVGYPFVDILQFGQMREDFSDISDGYILGNWPESDVTSRQWIGFPVKKTPTFAWAGLPAFVDNFNRNVWKHQCLSVNFLTGSLKYFLNGIHQYTVVNIYKDFKEEVDPLPRFFNFVSLGCAYQTTGSKIKSTVAQYTDLQMFGSELSAGQMRAYTTCSEFLQGDLLSWKDIPWILGGRKQVSELEYLDLEADICASQDLSFLLLPFPLKKEPYAEHMCSKLSSYVASYTNNQDLDVIVNHLANKDSLNENECTNMDGKIDDTYTLIVGVDGKLDADTFLNTSKGTTVTYFPWEEGRPWGGLHQCLFLSLELQDNGKYRPEVTSLTIRDEGCPNFSEGCFLC